MPSSPPRRSTVVIGLLGSVLDDGQSARRWERWRPSIGLCQQEDFLVDRFELLHSRRHSRLAQLIQKDLSQVAPETRVILRPIEFEDPWDFVEVYGALLDFARGTSFDLEHEDYYVHITTGTHVAQICLFLLTEARELPARLLQTSPSKKNPAGTLTVIDLDLSRYDRLAARLALETEGAIDSLKGGIATRNQAFNRLITEIEWVAARTKDPILLTGPTGAGKSRLAQRIHELRRARHLVRGSFVPLNCATLKGDGAMAALFGHKKGAFTGAASARAGLLRTADGGTLFLDEIGELGQDEQAMLLRAIEEKRFLPLGADEEVQSDFQLLAGTNKDLREEVLRGRFREDLLARLDLWTFRLPGLSERPEDIEPNLDYELLRQGALRQDRVRFTTEARAKYLQFATSKAARWSGNFRDLSASVTRLATFAPAGRITLEVVDAEIQRLCERWSAAAAEKAAPAPLPQAAESSSRALTAPQSPLPLSKPDLLQRLHIDEAAESLDLFDRAQLAQVLEVCAASATLSEAGRRLFAASRAKKGSTNDSDRLRKYLSRFGLSFAAIKTALAGREI